MNTKQFFCRFLILFLAFSIPGIALAKGGSKSSGAVHVNGYTRKDGTYVAPHYRSAPDGNFSNNWSTKGNVNPYTGKEGTKVSPSSRLGSDSTPTAAPDDVTDNVAPKAEMKKATSTQTPPAPKSQKVETEFRTWSSSSGKFKTDAKFGGVAFGNVALKKRDGSSIQVPLEKLSEEDQQWIKKQNKIASP